MKCPKCNRELRETRVSYTEQREYCGYCDTFLRNVNVKRIDFDDYGYGYLWDG